LEGEIITFNSLQKQEDELKNYKLTEFLQIPQGPKQIKAASSLFQNASKIIDEKADRIFSIHAGQAKTNGYGFQAYLITEKQLPEIIDSIKKSMQKKKNHNLNISDDIIKIVKSRKSWGDKANLTNLYDDYHFVYSFSSNFFIPCLLVSLLDLQDYLMMKK